LLGGSPSDKTVVFIVIADPKPDEIIAVSNRKSAICQVNARRKDLSVGINFFEMQAWMSRVVSKHTVGLFGRDLNLFGKFGE